MARDWRYNGPAIWLPPLNTAPAWQEALPVQDLRQDRLDLIVEMSLT